MICATCQAVLRDAERKITSSTADPNEYPGHYVFMKHSTRTNEQYALAIEQGCKFCTSMWRLSKPVFEPRFFVNVLRQPNPEGRAHFLEHGLNVEFESAVSDGYHVAFELEENRSCSHSPVSQSSSPALTTTTTTTTADAHSLELAQSWLETCLKEHQLCKSRGTGPSYYPERLIDIGFCQDKFRVIDTKSTQIQGPYMTLSHRWGTDQNKLNDQSVETLYRGAPVSSLSRTYQDAIAQTKRFGVRYLWIDSLCIFQDNTLDIRNAASSMAEVYSHSLCNISALTARQDGIFSSRNSASVDRSSFELCETRSGLSCCYLIHDTNVLVTDVVKTPLANRGWVAQEMMLAPRTIYFGENQLSWHCTSQSTWETDFKHQGSISWETPVYATAGSPFRIHSVLADVHLQDRNKLFQTWHFFVEHYCTLDLTYPSDKLLAVAGIAKKFGEGLRDDYLAGHWKSSLPGSLLWWRSNSHPDPRGRIEPHRCPSWSWAALRDPPSFRIPRGKVVSRFVGASVQTHNGDPFGMVNSATLSIQAMLVPLIVASKPCQPGPGTMFIGKMRTVDGLEFEAYNSLDIGVELPTQVFFALIATKTSEERKSDQAGGPLSLHFRLHVDGLLLRLVSRPCTFERIGNLEHSGTIREFSSWLPPDFMDFFERASLDEEPDRAPIDGSKVLSDIILI